MTIIQSSSATSAAGALGTDDDAVVLARKEEAARLLAKTEEMQAQGLLAFGVPDPDRSDPLSADPATAGPAAAELAGELAGLWEQAKALATLQQDLGSELGSALETRGLERLAG